MLDPNWKPWPLSEMTEAERMELQSLSAKQRDKRIEKLKRDIMSGEHARRKQMEELARYGE